MYISCYDTSCNKKEIIMKYICNDFGKQEVIMKKLSILAFMTAVGVAGSVALPVQAAEVSSFYCGEYGTAYVISGGQLCNPEEIKELLAGVCDKLPEIPDSNIPDNGIDVPEDNNAPDMNVPETLSYAEQVVALVNAERAKVGVGALTLDKEIETVALVRAQEIETSFSHTRPDGRSFSTALTDAGITFHGAGENIAWGQRSPEEVVNAWMNSEGHRANILNAKFTKIGVGYYRNSAGRNYWTQLFTY